ncbi:hypothetical protein M902_1152 [Bacteriovorax sp. BAL6_X]|uniref:hypothetical protein n=1 Tax=Bacteriovorax sp. BAL6_X TaxID=1201290 RepID=UPI0003863C18|nr:hypothetical protein [Bacteriovorax sp. BAL6_X]EPZ50163.1 hypothetical protein M902_1152 [Bacteriovorax sp. BAL6_X]
MKKLISMLSLVALLSSNTYALFGKKDNGIAGVYKGKESISLNYDGVKILNKCSFDGKLGFNALSVGAAAAAWSLGPLGIIGTFFLVQGWKQGVCFDNSYTRENIFKVKLEAKVVQTSSERITLMITSKDKKKCAGFSVKLIGEPDGFGGYDLFKNKESYLNNEIFGTATYAANELDIAVSESLTLLTKGRHGHKCVWDLKHGLNVNLKK